jgi:hypothetical protein
LKRSLEHGGKVFLLGIIHSTLLVIIGLRPPSLTPWRVHERTPGIVPAGSNPKKR